MLDVRSKEQEVLIGKHYECMRSRKTTACMGHSKCVAGWNKSLIGDDEKSRKGSAMWENSGESGSKLFVPL